MEWVQFVIFFLGVFGLFIWNRTEARNDIRHMDNKMEAIRNLVDAIRTESREQINAIRQEMTDFHNRLCDIERGRK